MKGGNNIADAIYNFDLFLHKEGYGRKFEAVIIGGAALILMGITKRGTRDVDFIDPIIPSELKHLSVEFMDQNPQYNLDQDTWINNDVMNILEFMPSGWRDRLTIIFEGKILKLHTFGRLDLLKTKSLSYVERGGRDYYDIIQLRPSKDELEQCKDWTLTKIDNPLWRHQAEGAWAKLRKGLGYV